MKLLPFMKENIQILFYLTCFFQSWCHWSQKKHLWSLMDSLEGPFGNMTILQVEISMVKGGVITGQTSMRYF